MEDLFTSRQLQRLLKVDRITIYRMVQDGRLKGVKIGQQWRFARSEVDRLLSGTWLTPAEIELSGDSDFPTHCVQTILDLFADVAQLGALMIDTQGNLLTQPSRPCPLCQLLLSSPVGLRACHSSWLTFAQQSRNGALHFTCHAGMQYVGAPVSDGAQVVGLFLVGGFYWQTPDAREEAGRLNLLEGDLGLPRAELAEALHTVPVIEPAQHALVESWPVSAAHAVQSILQERSGFMQRLQQIANLTQI